MSLPSKARLLSQFIVPGIFMLQKISIFHSAKPCRGCICRSEEVYLPVTLRSEAASGRLPVLTFLYKSRTALRTSYFNFPFSLWDANLLSA